MDKWALWFPASRRESLRTRDVSISDRVLRVLQILKSDHLLLFHSLPLVSTHWKPGLATGPT